MSVSFGYGVQFLIDSQLRWQRTAHDCYLRIRNFPDVQQDQWAQLGFTITPADQKHSGTTDILIEPPVSVRMVSVHNIGQSNGKLRFGARQFIISHTFVQNINSLIPNIGTDDLVFRGPRTVGIVIDSLLGSIEDVAHEEIAAQTVLWMITCNFGEVK